MSKLKGCEKYITKELVLLENFLIFGDIKKVWTIKISSCEPKHGQVIKTGLTVFNLESCYYMHWVGDLILEKR